MIKNSLLELNRQRNIKPYYNMNPFQQWYYNTKDLPKFLRRCEETDIQKLHKENIEDKIIKLLMTNDSEKVIIRLATMTA